MYKDISSTFLLYRLLYADSAVEVHFTPNEIYCVWGQLSLLLYILTTIVCST